MKSGFVSIVGRPNVGKSTLLNNIMNKKLAIISNKPGTTRNNIDGIYNDLDTQIIFIDTPGIHKPKQHLGKVLNSQAYYSIEDADVILFLVDVSEKLGKGDLFVINKLKSIDKPVILILNKIDKISKEEILIKIDEYKDLYPFCEIIPLSALKEDNLNILINNIKKYLTDEIKYYDNNITTNNTKEFMITELIREKILELTSEEVPHSVTCILENIEEKETIVNINACIIVDRDSLKKIIIGKKGSMIKEIGSKARIDIEELYKKQVFLELFVKTIPNWRDKDKLLLEFGIKNTE